MLAETEAELKEFQVSSKELEDEMQLDVERAEKAREDMQNKFARAESDRDEWKVCQGPCIVAQPRPRLSNLLTRRYNL